MIPPSSNPLDHLLNMTSPPRSSPPIYKPHNKFFDSLSIADRPLKSPRDRLSSSSIAGEWDEGYIGNLPTEEVIELQIGARSMISWAHYGYVVC